MVFRCCCDIEHPEHVESHVVSGSLRIFTIYLQECVCVCVCARVHAREGTSASTHVQKSVRVRGVHVRCKCTGTQPPPQGCERGVAVCAQVCEGVN